MVLDVCEQKAEELLHLNKISDNGFHSMAKQGEKQDLFLLDAGKRIAGLLLKETQESLFSLVFIPLGRIPMLNEKVKISLVLISSVEHPTSSDNQTKPFSYQDKLLCSATKAVAAIEATQAGAVWTERLIMSSGIVGLSEYYQALKEGFLGNLFSVPP